MRLAAAVFGVLLLPGAAWGGFGASAEGATAAGFLKLAAGARAVSMGEAYSAVVDDAGAIHWNPAVLSRLTGHSASFTHASHVGGSFLETAAYGRPLGPRGAVGVGFRYFSAGRLAQTDATGAEVGSFTPNDLALSAGYAFTFRDMDRLAALEGCSIGLSAKVIRSKIIDTASTFALDFGVLSPAYFDGRLSLAFAATNLGGEIKFDQEGEGLPLALRLGSSFKLTDAWNFGLDVAFPNDDTPYAALGAERLFPAGDGRFAVRAGFNSRTLGDVSGFSGVSFGFGFTLPVFGVDYGLLPFGSVGLSHRVSLTFAFGKAARLRERGYSRPERARASPPDESAEDRGLKRLAAELRSGGWEARRDAARALGEMGGGRAVGFLIRALADEHKYVRGAAARSLGITGDAQALRPLVDALEDSYLHVRASAAQALGELGDRRAEGALRRLLNDRSAAVREAASRALRRLGE